MSELDLKELLAPKKGADGKPESKSSTSDIPPVKKQADLLSPPGQSAQEDGLMKLLSVKKTAQEKPIENYSNVEIVDTGEELKVYKIKIPHLTPADRTFIESVQKVATKVIDVRKESANAKIRKESLKQKIRDMMAKSSSIKVGELKMDAYADIISREMGGYGLLDYPIDDEWLEEVMVVPPERIVYVYHRKHGMLKTNIMLDSDDYILNVVERIARDVGRRVDTNNPLLDARLPSGDRVNATLSPASVDGPSLTIRKFREDPYTMVDLINFRTINPKSAAFLWLCAEGMQAFPNNMLISGGTSSGKTTFLNCVSMFVRPTERVLTIEDTAELRLPLEHWIRLETRPPGIEGTGEITMDALLKNALRMRPDRIIVGEVRHSEAFTLFTAMNTGHQGSMGTIHANTAQETIVRLMSPPMNVPEQMATALNLIVILNRINVPKVGLVRRVTEIAEVTGKTKPELHLLFEWDSAKDELIRVDQNSSVLKRISKFSGASEKELHDELAIRERLLQEAAKKKVASIDDFALFLRKYYEKTK